MRGKAKKLRQKVAAMRKKAPKKRMKTSEPSTDDAETSLSSQNEAPKHPNVDTVAMESCTGMQSVYSGMQEWEELGTPLPVIRGLYDLKFTHPTPIQKQSIPPAIEQYDIIGAAETGSGKTLAFAIPIIHYVLKQCPEISEKPLCSNSPLTLPTSVNTTGIVKSAKRKKKLKSHPPSKKIKLVEDSSKLKDKMSQKNSSKMESFDDKSTHKADLLKSKKPGKLKEIIDMNQIIHTYEGESSSGDDTDSKPHHREDDSENLENDSENDSEGQTSNDEDEEERSKFDQDEQILLEDKSDSDHSLSDDAEIMSSDTEQPLSEDDQSGEDELILPGKKRARASSFRLLKERARAKKRLGFVAVRNHISDKEFQLMLEGKLDVWGPDGKQRETMDSERKTITRTLRTDKIGDESEKVVTEAKSEGSTLEETGLTESSGECRSDGGCGLLALILTPTRELAMQVHSHITAVAKYTNVKVCTVVGGMATEKQERLLKQRPQIVVATPGRLWKLMSEGDPHLCNLDDLHFLVLDEADRMVEYGHYKELGYILDRINGVRFKFKGDEDHVRQTLVFSATLAISRRTTEKRKRKKTTSSQETVDNLMKRVGIRDNVKIVDLTRSKVTVEMLTETKITCTSEEKDLHLYYFLLNHPGRTIVFVNSIDCLQRVRAILELLRTKPLPLHAHMQQRQRLKNLDRFTSSTTGVLVASDVAARGLDLPKVEHIIHYQVPRNTELYVHRSGRTARGQKEGLSVVFVGPEDVKSYKNICKTLNKDDIPNFPIDHTHLRSLKGRVSLARQVHTIEYRHDKARRSDKWMTDSAEALGMELEEDVLHGNWSKQDEMRLQDLRGELSDLLQSVVLPQGLSHSFPTRDQNHTLLEQLQGQRSIGRGKKEKALTVIRRRQK